MEASSTGMDPERRQTMTADPCRVRVGGPLAEHAPLLADELARRGYTSERASRHLQLLAQLSRWLQGQGLAASDLSEEIVARFVEARTAAGYAEKVSGRLVITLLGYLPALRVAPAEGSAVTPAAAVIEKYRSSYLARERGLAATTITGYLAVARLFLTRWERPDCLDLSQLTAGDVSAFVIGECQRRHTGSAKVLVTALRSLLRFLSLEGYTARPLAGAVPAVSGPGAGWLPRALDAGVVSGLLASCDTGTAAGRRDYAILTVLSRLGLRVGEVAGLQLDDIDWRHGELVVRGKGGRQDRLPVPADVGEAVAAYLCDARPRSSCRAVFLRVHAPATAMAPSTVGAVVGRACRRAGVPVAGAHRLRHSAATAMLRGGASLAEIGLVLRQSRAATTAGYARADRAALRALARPWPGAGA
jgi:integrase/recombinase XerD